MKKSKALDIVVAIACALCIWMYVVTVVTPDDSITIHEIPVVFQGETELRSTSELIVSNKSVSAVSIRFHGSRADLKRLNSARKGITAAINVSQFNSEREYSSGYEVLLPSALQDREIQVVDRNPRTVQFKVEKLADKHIPVKGIFDGTVASGFVAGELSFEQDSIKVTGPSELVDSVQYAQVVMGGERVSKTLTQTLSVTLIGRDGAVLHSNDLQLDAAELQVNMPVLKEVTVPLLVTPVYGAGATADNTTITVKPETVTLRGEPEVIEGLTVLELGELPLALVTGQEPIEMEIPMPEGTELADAEAVAVVNVNMTGLSTREIPVNQFRPENLADNMSASIITTSITALIRGGGDALNNLDAGNVYAVADLTEYTQPGSFTVPVRIETGQATVGAVGEYSVTVELKVIRTEE